MEDPHTASSGLRFSFILLISYAFDWIVLIAFLAAAIVLGNLTPRKRAFSLVDPGISYPYHGDTISFTLAGILSVIVPVAIILITVLFLPRGPVPRSASRTLKWRRKLWEAHVGILGLALSLISVFFFVQCMKNLLGKPRPNMLSRCEPDFANAAAYLVSGFANSLADGRLYSADICQQTDSSILDDGFRSFPSGHSSISAAGLFYLTLFLASKLAVGIPSVPSDDQRGYIGLRSRIGDEESDGVQHVQDAKSYPQTVRRQAAAAPLYLLALVLVPVGLTVYISCSRWFDYNHSGFDILFASFMGLVGAFFGFRFYHPSISRGAGWVWRPRSVDRAFWSGVIDSSYVGEEGDYGGRNDTRAFSAGTDRSHRDRRRHSHSLNGHQQRLDDIEL